MEREWKTARDDATDDEVHASLRTSLTDLTLRRTTCYRQHIRMIRLMEPMTDSALSLHREAERMSKLTGSLKTMSGESYLIKSAPPLLKKTRARTTRLSLVTSLDLLALIVLMQLLITTSSVWQMLLTTLNGRLRHHFSCQKLKSYPTIRRLCSCCLPIFRHQSLAVSPTSLLPRKQSKQKPSSLRSPLILPLSHSLPGNHRRHMLQARHRLYRHRQHLSQPQLMLRKL